MPSPGAPTEPTQPAAYKLPGCNLFASGLYKGQPWPPNRVKGIADNIRKLGPSGKGLIVPPAVLGHEEDQAWLDDTGLPAAGWVDPDSVTLIPDPENTGHFIIRGDVVNVPPEVADRIKNGEYANGSGEFYELFDDFGKSQGYTMRRFGLLGGGTIPQVKRLGRLPMPVPMAEMKRFSEEITKLVACSGAVFLKFAERTMFDKATALAAIKAAMPGLAQATLDALSDDALKDLVANLPTVAPTTPAAPAAPMDDAPPASAPTPPSRDEMIAALVAAGQDQATVSQMSDADLAAAYAAVKGKMADDPDADDPTKKKPVPPVSTMSETEKKAAESLKRINQHEAEAAKRHSVAAVRERKAKVKDAEAFCETLVKGERLLPHQKADYVTILVALDDSLAIHKFAENGKSETLSAYELKKRELERRPKVIKFGEKVAGGGTASPNSKDEALEKATKHAATVPESAWKQTSFGSSTGFVKKFGEAFDKSPETALKMIG